MKHPYEDPKREERDERRQHEATKNTERRRGDGRTDGPGPKRERQRDTDPEPPR